MRTAVIVLTVLALGVPVAGYAQNPGPDSRQPAGAKPAATETLADGEVRKVDRDAKKLTIRHGPLPQLDMPTAMTMVYQVKDPTLLDQVKAGDKIRFVAEKIGGQFTVVRIEPAR